MIKRILFGLSIVVLLAAVSCDDSASGGGTTVYYTVEFDSDGGTPVPAQSVPAGGTVSVPAQPDKRDSVFRRWSLPDEEEAYDFTTLVYSDLTLVAIWLDERTAEYWQVTWVLNSGAWPDGYTPVTQVVKGGTLAEPEMPGKTDSAFDGWYREAAFTNKVNFPWDVSAITDDITLYAKWISSGSQPEKHLTVSPDTPIQIGSDGGWSDIIFVRTDQPFWDAECDQPWFELDIYRINPVIKGFPDGEEGFFVYAEPNPLETGREGAISVTAGIADPVIISVTQAGKDAYLSVSPNYQIGFSKEGGTSDAVTVSTNQPLWNVASDQGWCAVNKNAGSFRVTVPVHTGSVRNAVITVSADYMPSVFIEVIQEGITGALIVGSYYYNDHSYSIMPDNSKTCVGIVFSVTGQSGLIVSLDETDVRMQWAATTSTTLASDLSDGAKNLERIQTLTNWQDNFPSFAWCAAKGEGWYMPSKDELCALMEKVSIVNSKLPSVGGTVIEGDFYWSSSEYTINRIWAWAWSTALSTSMASTKTGNCFVRAVYKF